MDDRVRYQWSAAAAPIVCGVDGSPASRRALATAAELAQALGVGLVALTAWQPATSMFDAEFPEPGRAPRVAAFGTLQEAVQEHFGDTPPDWLELRAEPGEPGAVLVAASKGALMLVVGCRGPRTLPSPFLGSVSLYCASQAACPVLVVRPEAEPGWNAAISPLLRREGRT